MIFIVAFLGCLIVFNLWMIDLSLSNINTNLRNISDRMRGK